jgi:SAM-dependent methyltransferase
MDNPLTGSYQRWLIPEPHEWHDRKEYWVTAHSEHQYADVFSVNEDEAVRKCIVEAALESPTQKEIMIVGCGSRVSLQRDLIAHTGDDTKIIATDYQAVIDLAQSQYSHPRLTYVALEEQVAFEARFDVVIAVNVMVSDSDVENRRLVSEWSRSLVHCGRLVALAPILSAGYELGTLAARPDLLRCLRCEESRWIEKHQGITEIEYLPLRLRRLLKEAGLGLLELRILFFEGSASRRQTLVHYGIDDDDLLVYEQLIVATRN